MLDQGRHAIYWQLALFVGAVVLLALLSRFFPIVDLVETLRITIAHWGAWGAACYSLIFAICNILLLPGGVLAVGGGFFFGLWWGFLLVFLGNVLGTAISFTASRWVANRWFRQRLSRNKVLRTIEPAVEREGWKIILLSQLHPLFPTSLLNYLYGLTKTHFRAYMLWASVGRIPGLLLYVYVGTLGQYSLRIIRGKQFPRVIEYWTWGGALLITIALLIVLSGIASRAVRNARHKSPPSTPSTRTISRCE